MSRNRLSEGRGVRRGPRGVPGGVRRVRPGGRHQPQFLPVLLRRLLARHGRHVRRHAERRLRAAGRDDRPQRPAAQRRAARPGWRSTATTSASCSPGENEIPVTVWVGVRATNTTRGRAGLRGRDDRVDDDHDLRRASSCRRRRSRTTSRRSARRSGPRAAGRSRSARPVGGAARAAGRSRRAAAEAAREASTSRPRWARRSSGWTASRDVLRRGHGAPGGGAGAVRRRRRARVLLPRRGAGGDERRAGERRPRAPRAGSRRRARGRRTALRPRSRTGCRRPICRRCATPGCWSRATTR